MDHDAPLELPGALRRRLGLPLLTLYGIGITSLQMLVVFALVNLSLLRLRLRKIQTHAPHVRVPRWVPAAGLATCLAIRIEHGWR